MPRLLSFALALGILLTAAPLPAPASARGSIDAVKVVTRNQYLGADLTPVILAQTPQEFLAAAGDALAQIAANDFPLRARRLAQEVAITRPDLIGLQEVFAFSVDGAHVGPPFVDHLAETLDALDELGQHYVVAATVEHLDVTLPIPGLGAVRVLDRDVILARQGIAFTPLGGPFGAGGLCGVPIPNPAFPAIGPPTLVSTPSEDGCNYSVLAEVNSPVGLITIERGFVGVDATVRGRTYRFVNTHLEVMQPEPGNPASAIIQSLQSVELVGSLGAVTPPDRSLVLLGDFNSSPEDPAGAIVPPYQVIVGQGYADLWHTNPLAVWDPEGFTCCQLSDLSNPGSLLDERIDLVFVRDARPLLPLGLVLGRLPIFPLSQPPNWASDHGGVFGNLIFFDR